MSRYYCSTPPTDSDPGEHTVEAVIGQLLTLERIANQQAEELRKAGVVFDGSDPRTELIRAETAAVCWHRCVTMLADVLKQRREGRQP